MTRTIADTPDGLPAGPRAPATVQLLRWALSPFPFLDRCARTYGPVFTVRFPRYPPIVMVSDPEIVREVFGGDPLELDSGSPNRLLQPLLGSGSVILLDGREHHQRRKLLMPAFHGRQVAAYGEEMRRQADRSIDRWPTGVAFRSLDRFQGITLRIIVATVFGVAESRSAAILSGALLKLMRYVSNPLTLLMVSRDGGVRGERFQERLGALAPWARFKRLRSDVDRLIFNEIENRRRAGDAARSDILSLLLAARDEHGGRLTDQELRDELVTLLVAGHETTATALAWALYRCLKEQKVPEQLQQELDEVTGGDPVSVDHLPRLRYLKAVVQESARLQPVLPFVVRELRSPTSFGGRTLPAGSIVAPNIYLTHRREDLWADPQSFDPTRFLSARVPSHQFFPFGGGARTCLGKAFATLEMQIVLGRIFQRVALELPAGYRARVIRHSIVLAPSKGVPVLRRDDRERSAKGAR